MPAVTTQRTNSAVIRSQVADPTDDDLADQIEALTRDGFDLRGALLTEAGIGRMWLFFQRPGAP